MGLALDFAQLSAQKADLQSANDAAVLYAAKHYQDHARLPSPKATQDYINDLFKLNVDRPSLHRNGNVLTLETATDSNAHIIHTLDVDAKRIRVLSTATIVLATTTSVSGKASNAQSAATKRQLQGILRDIERGKRISRDRWLSLQGR